MKNDFEIHLVFHELCLFQELYNELKERRPQIESLNRNGGKFVKEAKVSDWLIPVKDPDKTPGLG